MSLPWPICCRCLRSDRPTSRIGGHQLCQVCFERAVGPLTAYRFGLGRGKCQEGWSAGRCRTFPVDEDQNDNPWGSLALRALEDAPAAME